MRLIAAVTCLALLGAHASPICAGEPADPVASILASAPVMPFRKLSIQYAVRDTTGGVQKVELYGTTDMGKTWHRWGEDPDRQSPVVVSVPSDGIYGFAVVSTDRAGSRERPPSNGTLPQIIVIVDTEKPTGTFTRPAGREMMPADGIVLSWQTTDAYPAQDPVKIEFSTDNGQSWRRFRGAYPASSAVRWKPAPQPVSSYIFRMRVIDRAGNESLISAPGIILVDQIAPTVRITGPQTAERAAVDIQIEAEDNPGGLGVEWVELYATHDDGATWTRHARTKAPVRSISYTAEGVNRVGFAARAIDAAGNATAVPTAGTQPELVLTFDAAGPQITMEPLSRMIVGGSSVTIAWVAEDPNIGTSPVTVDWSADAGQTWESLAVKQPGKGSFTWKTPQNVGELHNCLVRVTAVDTLGNTSQLMSPQPFTISTRAPETSGVILDPRGDGVRRRTDDEPIIYDDSPVDIIIPGREPMERLDPESTRPVAGADARVEKLPSDIYERADTAPGGASALTGPTDTISTSSAPYEAIAAVGVVPAGLGSEPSDGVTPGVTPPYSGSLMPFGTGDPEAPVARIETSTQPTQPARISDPESTTGLEGIATMPTDVTAAVVTPTESEALTRIEGTSTPPTPVTSADPVNPVPPVDPVAPVDPVTAVAPVAPPVVPVVAPVVPVVPVATDGLGGDEADNARAQADLLGKEALALIDQDSFALARPKVIEAMRTDGRSPIANLAMARILAAEGDMVQAQASAQQAAALDGNYAAAFLFTGDLAYTRAKGAARQIIDGQRARVDDADLAPYIKEFDNHVRDAVAAYQRATELEPKNKDGYDKLGEIHYYRARIALEEAERQRAYFDAVSWFRKGYDIGTPSYSEAFHLGKILYAQDKLEPAATYFLKGIDVCPAGRDPRECYWYLAEIEEKRKYYDNAIHYWQRAAKGYEDNPDYAREALNRAQQLEQMLQSR